jgi:hypothetical protein
VTGGFSSDVGECVVVVVIIVFGIEEGALVILSALSRSEGALCSFVSRLASLAVGTSVLGAVVGVVTWGSSVASHTDEVGTVGGVVARSVAFGTSDGRSESARLGELGCDSITTTSWGHRTEGRFGGGTGIGVRFSGRRFGSRGLLDRLLRRWGVGSSIGLLFSSTSVVVHLHNGQCSSRVQRLYKCVGPPFVICCRRTQVIKIFKMVDIGSPRDALFICEKESV